MKKLTDKEWLRVFNQFFDQCFNIELKNGLSTKEAMELAFQKTVDLEYHHISQFRFQSIKEC